MLKSLEFILKLGQKIIIENRGLSKINTPATTECMGVIKKLKKSFAAKLNLKFIEPDFR